MAKVFILSSLMPDMDNSGKEFTAWITEGCFSTEEKAHAQFDKLRAESPIFPMRIESTEIDSDSAPIIVDHYYPSRIF